MIVIVPNALSDAIYAKVDAALADCQDAAADREYFYAELLAHFNEYGVIPEFTLQKKAEA